MLQQVLAVFLVLALLITTLAVLRKKGLAKSAFMLPGRSRAGKEMQVMDRIVLTANHSLHLVKVRDRVILVGVSPAGCNELESFPGTSDIVPGNVGQAC